MSLQMNNLSIEQRQGLALSCRDFAFLMAIKFNARCKGDIDEMKSSALEGLCYASTRYDPTLGFAFSTYAYFWIRDRLTKEIDRQRRRGFRRCPDDIRRVGDPGDRRSDGLGCFKNLESREERPDEIVEKKEIFEVCSGLEYSYRQRQVFEMMFRDELSAVEIARKLKISKQRILQLKNSVIKRIKKSIRNDHETKCYRDRPTGD